MDNSKRKNIYIIVFVITTIIAACVAVYFGIKVNEGKGDLQIANKDIEEYKQEVTTLKTEVDKLSNTSKPDSNQGTVTNTTFSNKNMIANLSKCINPQKNIAYFSSCNVENDSNITIKQGNILKFVNKKYDSSTQESVITFMASENIPENNKIVTNKEYPITGIVGNVIDTARYRNQVAFLTKEGNVYCYDINDAINNNRFVAKKIPDISNISKLALISSVFDSADGYIDGHYRIGAVKEDGSFYDLTEYINTQFK